MLGIQVNQNEKTQAFFANQNMGNFCINSKKHKNAPECFV